MLWLLPAAGTERTTTHQSEASGGKRHAHVKALHAQFHQAAGVVAELAIAGRKTEAEAAMAGDYARVSATLTQEMQDWDASL